MDDLMARTMVENLSVGIDPTTGQALPAYDSCANELVQEALRTVLEHCTLESYGTMLERKRKGRRETQEKAAAQGTAQYLNAGKPWSRGEDQRLWEMYTYGRKNAHQIAKVLQRSPKSIASRLRKLGLR